MASVLASRILGFVREWTVAYRLGSSAETDAYYAAFTLPDFLNYLVAGGALSITFIPIFSKYLAGKTRGRGLESLFHGHHDTGPDSGRPFVARRAIRASNGGNHLSRIPPPTRRNWSSP